MTRLQITRPDELSIEIDDGGRFPIHPLWLRERCQDSKTIDPRTGQRWQDASDFDPSLRLSRVSEIEPGRFRVRFTDGHEADFRASDIIAEAALPSGDHDCPPARLWDSSLTDLPRFESAVTPASLPRRLFSRLTTFLFGDGARLDAVDLRLIHLDQNIGRLLDFRLVVIRTEERHRVAAAVPQRWCMRFENDRDLRSAIPRPMHLVARDSHDVPRFASIASSVDEEIDFSGDDIVHLLAVVLVRTRVIARRALREHETGVSSMDLL